MPEPFTTTAPSQLNSTANALVYEPQSNPEQLQAASELLSFEPADELAAESDLSRQHIEHLTSECNRLSDLIAVYRKEIDRLVARVQSTFTSSAQKRELSRILIEHGIGSQRRVCKLLGLSRSTYWYAIVSKSDYIIKRSKNQLGGTDKKACLLRFAKKLSLGYPPNEAQQQYFKAELIQQGVPWIAHLVDSAPRLAAELFIAYSEDKQAR